MTGLSAEPRQAAEPADTPPLSARETLARNGRSFYWASRLLGRQMATDAAELYAFCRLLDDIADGDASGGAERLGRIRSQLVRLDKASLSGEPDKGLAACLPVIRRCGIPVAPLVHLLDGLLADQKPMFIRDQDALVRYAYHVAGAVGLLMCPVLGCRDPAAFRFAVDMGIGMQLTNIARDISEDAYLGRRYLPESWCGALRPDQIIACSAAPDTPTYKAVQGAADKLVVLADTYYESGRKGLAWLPLRARLGIAVAGSVYREIGIKARRTGLRWGDGRVVTSTTEKLGASLAALGQMGGSRTARHDPALHQPIEDLIAEAIR